MSLTSTASVLGAYMREMRCTFKLGNSFVYNPQLPDTIKDACDATKVWVRDEMRSELDFALLRTIQEQHERHGEDHILLAKTYASLASEYLRLRNDVLKGKYLALAANIIINNP